MELLFILAVIYGAVALISTLLFVLAAWNESEENVFSDFSSVLKLSIIFAFIWPVTYTWALILMVKDFFKKEEEEVDET